MIKTLKPTTTKKEVPLLFHESYVETGFRPVHQPWSYYLCSLFQKHNECLNCWTHLVGLLFALGRARDFSKEHDLIGDPYMWPLGAGLLTMIIMYVCSTGAHCFSSRSELIHYTAFMIDYGGIGVYGLGSVILHHWYCHDDSMINSWLQENAVPLGVVLGVVVCFCCSISKVLYTRPYPFARKIWQLSSVGSIYTFLLLPILHRFVLYLVEGKWDLSLHPHGSHILWFLIAGFFFGSDIPQRFFPGQFDFLGHSHQIFHVCIVMVTERQLDAVALELMRLENKFSVMPVPTFWTSYGAVLLLMILNSVVVASFAIYASMKIERERKPHSE